MIMGTYTHSTPTGLHPTFDPGPLDGPRQRVLVRIDHLLAQAVDWDATVTTLAEQLTADLARHVDSLGPRAVPDAFFKQRKAALEEAIGQLTTGVAFDAGVIPALAKFAGK